MPLHQQCRSVQSELLHDGECKNIHAYLGAICNSFQISLNIYICHDWVMTSTSIMHITYCAHEQPSWIVTHVHVPAQEDN